MAYRKNKTSNNIAEGNLFANMLNMVLRRQKIRFCHFCYGSDIKKQFSKNIFMSILPIPVQTKVHFKILQFFFYCFFSFDMSFLRRALHVV